MDEVIKAIVTLFGGTGATAIALRAAVAGGVYNNVAPSESAASAVSLILMPVTAPVSWTMGTAKTRSRVQNCDVQFTLVTLKGGAALVAAADAALVALFDDEPLTGMTGQRWMASIRLSGPVGPKREDVEGEVTGAYSSRTEYRFMVANST